MENKNKIEKYLLEMGVSYEEIEDGFWVLDDIDQSNKLAVYLDESIVVFRIKVMEVPNKSNEEFFKKLLELNAYDLVHGAYAIENENVVIVDTLQIENLDLDEFRASIESIDLSLDQHKEELKKFL